MQLPQRHFAEWHNAALSDAHACSLLDPSLATSYPSAILAREKALVVNLEFVKCIITRCERKGGGC